MKVCAKGHEYRGDENYRARSGRCPVCNREAQARYDRTEKGKARRRVYDQTDAGRTRHLAYNHTDKGDVRNARYDQSPKGWKHALNNRRQRALQRRKLRQEAEDSHG